MTQYADLKMNFQTTLPVYLESRNYSIVGSETPSIQYTKMNTLNETERTYVDQLRQLVKNQLTPTYDTDFNLLRWIIDAERLSKKKGNIELAAKNLQNHLRYRRSMKFDERPIPSLDENPMFVERYQSKPTLHYLESSNKLLCWLEYGSFDTAGILHKLSTTEMLMYNFYLFEVMLKEVNKIEARTGRRSGVHMLMDVKGFEMNPWTVLFASNGQLAQLISVFGYEHYPELVQPYSIINTPKWLLWPIKLIKTAMPKDFNDRFHFYDHRYTEPLMNQMTLQELPEQLGGRNPESDNIQPQPGRRIPTTEYYQHKATNETPKSQLAHLHLHAGQRKVVPVRCSEGSTLSWFFSTDGDINFGVFFDEFELFAENSTENGNVLDRMEMVHPYFRLGAKLVPERGSLLCERNGTYYIVLCNKHSWFYKRNIYLKLEIDDMPMDRKIITDSAYAI